ncbi:site-specific integrase [Nesterenkonia sp. CF4.4]|uniref:site-specific integrase n=1 Tax=Nesterenkonia sp. CF4.4 TaxID=3373079 RepID=UPI003EE678B2
MAYLRTRENGTVQVRWWDLNGSQRSKTFGADEKRTAKAFKSQVETQLNAGINVDLRKSKTTFSQWAEVWKQGQRMHRPSTYRQVESDLKRLEKAFGDKALRSITVSFVRAWVGSMQAEGLEPSTVYARHSRLKQVMEAAVDEGLLQKSPVGRKTAPKLTARQFHIPTTEQVWELHGAMPEGLRPAILLGAFAGLRNAEAVALRTEDVDFMRGEITPKIQHGGGELKTESSRWTIPIADELSLELSRYVDTGFTDTFVQSAYGQRITPTRLQVHVSQKAERLGFYEGFRFHDLRHFYASALIAAGLDVVAVQHCLRHAKASTTLNTYGHFWPDTAEAPRAAVSKLFAANGASEGPDAATSASSG